MSSRSLDDLSPDVKAAALRHIKLCADNGEDLMIYCTLRSNEEQDKLYAIGRTVSGKIVTNARAGQSKHNPDALGKAHGYDCVPLRQGKPVWSSSNKEDAALLAKIGKLGEDAGLVWSGRWMGKLREMAHFQI
jgi:peptidoglycan L-alanyl-D-glutamate endopeptidase CwlK